MKHIIVILILIPFLNACKSKKDIVKTNPSKRETFYIQDVQSNQAMKFIYDENISPDGKWKLEYIGGQHDDEMQRVTLNLSTNKADKGFDGNDACNSYFGKLSVFDKRNIVFGGISATERACIVPAKYAQLYYNKLKLVKSYYTIKDYLLLNGDNGKALLQFKRAKE